MARLLRPRRNASPAVDHNNNNNDFIQLPDGTTLNAKGDFVWIKHENCLNTPSIVHHLLRSK